MPSYKDRIIDQIHEQLKLGKQPCGTFRVRTPYIVSHHTIVEAPAPEALGPRSTMYQDLYIYKLRHPSSTINYD